MKTKHIILTVVAVAAVVTAGAFTVRSMASEKAAKRDLQYTYERAYSDLRDSVDNIALTLDKGIYANTSTQQNGLAARLMRETSLAKEALATLPLSGTTMDSVSKYISQVGDLAMTLSDHVSAGGSITDKDFKTIQQLHTYATKLSTDLSNLKLDYTSTNFSSQFKKTAEDFTDFPSLIYDGPFSDHIGRQAPRLLEGQKDTAQGNAQVTAAEFLGLQENQLTHTADTAGGLPSYNFTAGSTRLSVTKKGGIVYSLENSREVTTEKLDEKAAEKKATTFLEQHGCKNMRLTYWIKTDGRFLFNFAYQDGKVLCYPDLIKVGVALDNGEIVNYDADGYVMNHTTRTFQAPKFDQNAAQKKVSSYLKVNSAKLALVPTEGLHEVLCWEFNCTGSNNDRVLVYINCKNNMEQQILILQASDTGTLVK
ncbi:MAG: germination protein YpeB [Oscillospiraceae bacterium]|nr:germination protein YpeB [Oscillospiraceae bacterium]